MDEPTLIGRAAAGDASAWEPLVLAHQEAVFRLAYLMLGDADDAQDVAQETFLRAWHHIGSFDRSRALRPWLLSIAARLASNRRRSAGRYISALVRGARVAAPPLGVEEKSLERADAVLVWQAVRRLDATDQQLIYLRYFLDLSIAEAAQTMHVAEGTIKSRSSRALERLRNVIQSEFPMLKEERTG